MALSGSERVSVVARNGIPVARTLDDLAGTSAYDALHVVTSGGHPVTVAEVKAGSVPAGHVIPQVGVAAGIPHDVINGHFTSYSGPLDLVAGAAVAYGQRALSSALRNTALYTIRRTLDDETQSFSSDATSGDAPVSDITAFLNGSNAFVETWNDQSGHGVDLGQSSPALQYGWAASGQGGRPVVFMDSTVPSGQAMFTTGNVSLPNGAYTVFAVAKLPPDNFPYLIGINTQVGDFTMSVNITGDPTDQIEFFAADTDGNNAGGRSAAISHGLTDYALFEIAWTFGTKAILVNGATVSVANDEDATGAPGAITKPLALGVGDPSFLENQDSHFAELVIYPSLLSTINRAALRTNIAAYYGITLS